MDHTLTGLEFVESFVDDCLIFSKTFREHMEHVKEVLLRLRYAGIQLRSEKCRFGYTKIDFLGPISLQKEGCLRRPPRSCC